MADSISGSDQWATSGIRPEDADKIDAASFALAVGPLWDNVEFIRARLNGDAVPTEHDGWDEHGTIKPLGVATPGIVSAIQHKVAPAQTYSKRLTSTPETQNGSGVAWSFNVLGKYYTNLVGGGVVTQRMTWLLDLPSGATITRIRAAVAVPSAAALATKVSLALLSRDIGSITVNTLATFTDAASTLSGYQAIHIVDWSLSSPISTSANTATTCYWLEVLSDTTVSNGETRVYVPPVVTYTAEFLNPGGA